MLLNLLHAEDTWIPYTNAGKAGDNPNYGSKSFLLGDILFDLPPTLNNLWPEEGAVGSANCNILGTYEGHKVVQANLTLSKSGYQELLLILCGREDNYKVVLASLQSKASQYIEVVSAKKIDNKFVIQTRHSIPGTNPYTSLGTISLAKKGGELILRRNKK